eukprot:Lankesteria_metandrocarpae@DN2226_c0_g1_i2.p1
MPSPQSSSTPPRAATAKSAVRPGGRTTTVGATSATGPSPVAVNCSSTAANSSATTAAAVVRGDGTAMGATARVAHRLLCLQRPTNPTESGAVPVRAGAIVSVFRHAACLRPNAQIPPIVCIETTETSIIAAHEDGITIAVFDSATPLAHRTGNAKYDVPRQSTVATS